MQTIESIEISISKGESKPDADPVVMSVALSSMAIAQQASALGNLAYSNQVGSTDLAAKSQIANQDAMNRLRQTILANAVASVQTLDPATARASVAALTSNDMAQQISALKAAIGAFTPPS